MSDKPEANKQPSNRLIVDSPNAELAPSSQSPNTSVSKDAHQYEAVPKSAEPVKSAAPPKEEEKKKPPPPPKASFRELFYFVEGGEKAIVLLAILFACAQGCGMPIFSYIFGGMADSFSSTDKDKIESDMNNQLIQMVILASVILVVATCASVFWNLIAGKQASRIKAVYFRKLLYQSTTWYDGRKVDEVAANFVDQISSLTAIFSEKIHMLFMSLAMVTGGLVVGFIKGWLLTLLLICLTPLLFVVMYFFLKAVMKAEEVGRVAYGEAGSVTDECFTFIKTVKSLSGEEHEIDRYTKSVAKAQDASIKYGWVSSLMWGLFFGAILVVYGLAYLIGSRLILNHVYNSNWGRDYIVGDVLTIFFCVIMGIMSLGQVGPIMKSISAAQVAVASILAIIKDSETEKCGTYRPEKIRGEFVFENVSFAYPSNPTVQVLKNINLRIEPGMKAAFVGPSGCGKSTVVGLLQRYYDPTEGRILLDGVDLKEYDLKFLRTKLSLVSQQPMLFADSIRFNMVLGTDINSANDTEIWSALELAEAKAFVEALPKGLDEYVGSMGGQLSGGQKQRIAIARTLIRKPDVFLFDEATSALDRTNEMEIQKTIDEVAAGRTSVTIAHRLTTIRNSDVIFVFKKGEIVESGNHDQLIEINGGIYHNLVKFQVEGLQEMEEEEAPKGPDSQTDSVFKNDSAIVDSKFQSGTVGSQTMLLAKLPSLRNHNKVEPGDLQPVTDANVKKRYSSIYKLLGPEKRLIPMGILASAIHGAVMPVFGFLMGNMIQNMGKLSCLNEAGQGGAPATGACYGSTVDEVTTAINNIVIGFCGVAVGAFLFTSWQFATFNYLGEKFTFSLRQRYFRRLMYMDMRYFDRTENQPGTLSARLATQCKKVNILVGNYLGTIFQAAFSFIIGIILALIFSWRVSLITLALSPFMILSSWINAKVRTGSRGGIGGEKSKIDGSEMLTDSINNMRVVRSLTAEDQLQAKFKDYDKVYKKRLMKDSIISGILFGLSQFFMFMIYAAVFRISVVFIQSGDLTPDAMFKSMFSMLFGLFGVGQSSQFLSDIEEVRKAAEVILADMNEPSLIEVDPKDPLVNVNPNKGLRPQIDGKIEFRNVTFRYEGRKYPVLNRLTIRVPKGLSCALVGSSGCGKSTVMQMIMRFYDPEEGQILLDDIDIRDIALDHLRRSFGIVRQEPSLFNGSIDYNIRYNHPNLDDVEVKEAADLANATEFVYSTPEGFQRNVGNRGEKLSGGQKQRIAIARVVAQKPKIYLFDEATSALDSNSEEVVQRAIERISSTTTSLTIAHRISTIKNSDIIFVLEKGRVIEKGSYEKLMNLNGRFAELARG